MPDARGEVDEACLLRLALHHAPRRAEEQVALVEQQLLLAQPAVGVPAVHLVRVRVRVRVGVRGRGRVRVRGRGRGTVRVRDRVSKPAAHHDRREELAHLVRVRP